MNWVIAYFAIGALFVCGLAFGSELIEDSVEETWKAVRGTLIVFPIWPVLLCVMVGRLMKRRPHD